MSGPDTIPTVSCEHLRKSFGSTLAVEDLSVEVERAQITALLGPSGCGKTTALRLIAGFERPDAGRILLDGEPVAGRGVNVPPERRRVGMVFQDYALFPHLNVADNVAYGVRDRPRSARHDQVRRALALVGLEGLERRLPAELSGGQQQRVALARALAPEPRLVLLDEPFSNLDAALRASVRAEVREILKSTGITAVFVTHDQEEALSLADKVAVMRAGRIHQLADPFTLYNRPADRFVATFVGDADIVQGHRRGRYFVETALGKVATIGPVESDTVDVVLRPEALRIEQAADGAGRVTDVVYFGHDQLVRLELPDGGIVRCRLGPTPHLRTGDRADVRVTGSVVALPHEGGANAPSSVESGQPTG